MSTGFGGFKEDILALDYIYKSENAGVVETIAKAYIDLCKLGIASNGESLGNVEKLKEKFNNNTNAVEAVKMLLHNNVMASLIPVITAMEISGAKELATAWRESGDVVRNNKIVNKESVARVNDKALEMIARAYKSPSIDDVDELNKEIENCLEEENRELTAEEQAWFKKVVTSFKKGLQGLYENSINGSEFIRGVALPNSANGLVGPSILYRDGTTGEYDIALGLVWKDFVYSCRKNGVNIDYECSNSIGDCYPLKYNPFLQMAILNGSFAPEASGRGWKAYIEALVENETINQSLRKIAIEVAKLKSGTDEFISRQLSSYTISFAFINYSKNGYLVRISCGYATAMKQIMETFRQRIECRKNRVAHDGEALDSLRMGQEELGALNTDGNGVTTFYLYFDRDACTAEPTFLGETLYDMREGVFKPSLSGALIGKSLKNDNVTINLLKNGPFFPILAGPRSGKGVITLGLLINAMALGAPIMYWDGKPDMAITLQELANKYGVNKTMILDHTMDLAGGGNTNYAKPYKLGIADAAQLAKVNAPEDVIGMFMVNNLQVIMSAKMLAVADMIHSYRMKNSEMLGVNPGKIPLVLVLDEMTVWANTMAMFDMNVKETGLEKDKISEKDSEDVRNLMRLVAFVRSTMLKISANSVAKYNSGLIGLCLGQNTADMAYACSVKPFFKNSILKTSNTALLGKRFSQAGNQANWQPSQKRGENGDLVVSLVDENRHWILTESDRENVNTDKVFKPLLTLNECDAMEVTGKGNDGYFIDNLINTTFGDDRGEAYDIFRKEHFSNVERATSIGFEGAIGLMASLTGKSLDVIIRDSLGGAYELANKALEYYGIIGCPGINDAYEYICSTDVRTMWKLEEIYAHKDKRPNELMMEGGDGSSSADISFGVPDVSEVFDNGTNETPSVNVSENLFKENEQATSADFASMFGSDIEVVDDDEYERAKNREYDFGGATDSLFADAEDDVEVAEDSSMSFEDSGFDLNEQGLEEIPSAMVRDENDLNGNGIPDVEEQVPVASTGNAEIFDDSAVEVDDSSDLVEMVTGGLDSRFIRQQENKPFSTINKNSAVRYNDKGYVIIDNKQMLTKPVAMHPDKCILPDVRTTLSHEKALRLGRTVRGQEKLMSLSWDLMLKRMEQGVGGRGGLTVLKMAPDNITANSKFIWDGDLVGGQTGITLCDIVVFDKLFKRFPGIKQMTLSGDMWLALSNEFVVENNDYVGYIFGVLKQLNTLVITTPNGTQKVTRAELINVARNKMMQEYAAEVKARNQMSQALQSVRNSKGRNKKNWTPEERAMYKRFTRKKWSLFRRRKGAPRKVGSLVRR